MKQLAPTPTEKRAVLLGNEAMARAALEAGCAFAAAYPGTPSSEILAAVAELKNELGLGIHVEWSTNEKVAFEVAYFAAVSGLRSMCSMKQVGVNVATDPCASAAFAGVKGGFVILACDDPGLHSSQTEQDSRLFGQYVKLPVFDPADPADAQAMIRAAFDLSEEFELPVIVRPTTRVCHARQDVPLREVPAANVHGSFTRNPNRWAPLPGPRRRQLVELNEKMKQIQARFEEGPFNATYGSPTGRLGIIASGACAGRVLDILDEVGPQHSHGIGVLKVGTPNPLPWRRLYRFLEGFERILMLEELNPTIEMQLRSWLQPHGGPPILGQMTGHVPMSGEYDLDFIYRCISKVMQEIGGRWPAPEEPETAGVRPRGLSLCAGCGHRGAFFAMRRAFPKAFYPCDIGCYTLGLNQGAADTCLCMGGSVSAAAGLYWSHRHEPNWPPIVATIGDSTFMHSGIPPLINAVTTGARFVLVILDNGTTAMTGNQPTAATGVLADGRPGVAVPIRGLVEATGIEFVREVDAYDIPELVRAIREADAHTRSPEGRAAVVIARRPCVMIAPVEPRVVVEITDRCNGCGYCEIMLACPALVVDREGKSASIDRSLCADCGVCIQGCPRGAIKCKG
ncbi:MAG: indolepyruvate ferredoxin oxidoreductase subunit alpha [Chloroflexi bacterium]|nr:indolepyruvate ferredoxin oxidoreductase subunit alpha [Chloroflexota bacterium]